MLAGFFSPGMGGRRFKWSASGDWEEFRLPLFALLARIRRLIPSHKDDHYQEIVRSVGVGALRPPSTPMSDRELARAIAEFLKETPSAESVSTLGRRLDPSSPV
jgi:hypothetical protein